MNTDEPILPISTHKSSPANHYSSQHERSPADGSNTPVAAVAVHHHCHKYYYSHAPDTAAAVHFASGRSASVQVALLSHPISPSTIVVARRLASMNGAVWHCGEGCSKRFGYVIWCCLLVRISCTRWIPIFPKSIEGGYLRTLALFELKLWFAGLNTWSRGFR